MLLLLAVALCAPSAWATATKTISGKLRAVKDNVLTIQKANLFDSSIVEVEMNGDTKVTGELAQGLHVKVTYREERGKEEPAKQEQGQAAAGKDKDSGRLVVRRIATKVQTWPQDASRSDRKAEKDTQQ